MFYYLFIITFKKFYKFKRDLHLRISLGKWASLREVWLSLEHIGGIWKTLMYLILGNTIKYCKLAIVSR